jgi:hypothetical protein
MRIEEWADEGDDPTEQDNYLGWDLYITVGRRTYYARRYKDNSESITFHYFSDPKIDSKDQRQPFSADMPEGDRLEPFRGSLIPYDDPLFQAAVREVLSLDGVRRIDVFTSNETGLPVPVDLARLPR